MEKWRIDLIVGCVMLVPGIHVFRLYKQLLFDGEVARVIVWLFGFAAAGGIVFAAVHGFDRISIGTAVALAMPYLHRLFVRWMFRGFVRRMGREPLDVAFNWTSGLAADRMFAINVYLGCVFGAFAIIGYFFWGTAVPPRAG